MKKKNPIQSKQRKLGKALLYMQGDMVKAINKNTFALRSLTKMMKVLVYSSLDIDDDESVSKLQLLKEESEQDEDEDNEGDEDDDDELPEPLEFFPRYIR